MERPEILKREIKALAFDQYGTIVDMQKGLTEAVTPFLKAKGWDGAPDSFVTWWRRTHFENSMIDALIDRGHTPYRQIGHRAVSHVMDRCKISYTQDEVRWLVSQIESLKPFPDVVAALEKLRARRLQARHPLQRRPRHAESRWPAHRLCLRPRDLGAGGRLFQAALEDLRQGRGDHRPGALAPSCSSPTTPSTVSAPRPTACARPSSTAASARSARRRTSRTSMVANFAELAAALA